MFGVENLAAKSGPKNWRYKLDAKNSSAKPGRKSVEENPIYQEVVKQLQPLKNRVANARFEAQQIVENAKREVENEKLRAIKWGLDNGLTQYAIGKATGETNAERQRALVARARNFGGE